MFQNKFDQLMHFEAVNDRRYVFHLRPKPKSEKHLAFGRIQKPKPRVQILADSGFFKNFLYQGGVKSTVSWVFEDPKFKISEG